MDGIVFIGIGTIRLRSEGIEIILPREAELIVRTFWKEPKACEVYYDRIKDRLHIVPRKVEERTEELGELKVKIIKRSHLDLHDAIVLILYINGNKPMKPSEILEKIKIYNLYRTKKGEYPSLQQIHARISNYLEGNRKGNPEYFKRTNEGIILTDKGIKLAEEVKNKQVEIIEF